MNLRRDPLFELKLLWHSLRNSDLVHVLSDSGEILKAHGGGAVSILPLFEGDIDFKALQVLRQAIVDVFGIRVQVLSPTKPTSDVLITAGGQTISLDGDKTIVHLALSRAIENKHRLIVMTDIPIHTARFEWVHGYAGLKDPVGIISKARMKGAIYGQLFRVCIHEIAHTFGLPHCKDSMCIMHCFSPNQKFCDRCIGRLLSVSEKYETAPDVASPMATP